MYVIQYQTASQAKHVRYPVYNPTYWSGHMKYSGTWSTVTQEVQWHMKYSDTWSTVTHEVQWHMKYSDTWSTVTHEVQWHKKCSVYVIYVNNVYVIHVNYTMYM